MRKFFQDHNQEYLETRSSTREDWGMVDSEKDDLGHAVGPGARVHVCHPALDL
ncbi:hypothetical protein [Streptococcus iners]|uniref:Uncharacterized protein n=1 Tax=Streptococcus iners subsp. hyiners TaxID=3028083 RepID=A0AA96VFW5_9STRE|nr:hypothetical protein [Streptococcus sp. 29892]WNY49000.1 hypothetical protein PW220_09800 [Streptococcus sp. 29892]